MNVSKDKLKRMRELVDMVRSNDTKGCPDPVGGGCMGRYCTTCAVRELRAHFDQIEQGKEHW